MEDDCVEIINGYGDVELIKHVSRGADRKCTRRCERFSSESREDRDE